jgi:hypothetical protein
MHKAENIIPIIPQAQVVNQARRGAHHGAPGAGLELRQSLNSNNASTFVAGRAR